MEKGFYLEDYYKELRAKHKNIVEVSSERIRDIQSSMLERHSTINNAAYYMASLTLMFFFATGPFIVSTYYDYSLNVEEKLLAFLDRGEYLREHFYIKISCLLLGLAIPTYTIIMPSKSFRFLRKVPFKLLSLNLNLNRKTFSYGIFVFTLNYLV